MDKLKLIRITTVPVSLKLLLKGQLRFMTSKDFDVIGVSSAGNELEEVAQDENIRVIPIPMTRKIDLLSDMKALWQLFWLFRKEKPSIVHTHTPKAGTLGMMAAKFSGVPIRLHTVAGLPLLESTGGKRWLLDIVEKITYACATKVYPNSKGLLDIIIKNKYAGGTKLKILGQGSSNGIDISFFSAQAVSEIQKQSLKNTLHIQQDEFVFIFIGRLVGDKGINELISAFAKLQKQSRNKNGKKVKLLLVGQYEKALYPLEAATEQEIESNANICYVGFKEDVRPYFAISDVLVFPSYREGFPNVVMQAGAMGLPSIVSDINGCNEIIQEGVNGTLVPSKNMEALYKIMLRMMIDDDWRMNLKNKAREMIASRYQRENIWKEILAEYHSLLQPNEQ